MKIALVIDDSLDKPDGVQQYCLNLGAWLAGQGHTVHYLAGETHRTDLKGLHSLARNVQVRFNQNRMSMPRPVNASRIKAILAQEQYDVLHIMMPYSPFLAGRLVRLAGSRTAVVGTFHIAPYAWFERLATKLLGWWLRPSLRRFDTVLSVSAAAQAFAKEAFGVDSEILPNVVDVNAFRRAVNPTPPPGLPLCILFFGRLVDRKGCQYLLRAVKTLKDRGKLGAAKVLIGGKGPMLDQLQAYVDTHDLGGNVTFLGFVPEEQKVNLLASADLAVFPSTGGESFGIVLIEAMAAGARVVIGGDNPGYAGVLGGQPDQLVHPRHTNKFADTLERFMADADLRAARQRWQQIEVERYDVAVVGQRLLKHYQDAIAKRSSTKDNTA